MSSVSALNTIQLGDFLVIQRQKYIKLQRFHDLGTTTWLGNDKLELRSLLGQPYDATFQMCFKEKTNVNPNHSNRPRGHRGSKRHCTLKLCTETELRNLQDVFCGRKSGADNRNISDDGDSQILRKEDIEQLRDTCNDSTKIIEKIVENSKTFHSKTEYSQEKYLKKKEKKYYEFVQIRRPSLRLITDIYHRQSSDDIMSLRADTLSQIVSYSGVCAFGNYLIYETGTNGLLPATFLNAMGADTEAKLVHMHPGNEPQKKAFLALNFPAEQQQRCISVNIYSVLRDYYQKPEQSEAEVETAAATATKAQEIVPVITETVVQAEGGTAVAEEQDIMKTATAAEPMIATCIDTAIMEELAEPESKKQKLDIKDSVTATIISAESNSIATTTETEEFKEPESKKQKLDIVENVTATITTESDNAASTIDTSKFAEPKNRKRKQKRKNANTATTICTTKDAADTKSFSSDLRQQPKWLLENRRALPLMREKFDSLVIVAKEHPATILDALLPLIKPSRPVVIFNPCKEVLMELYVDLKRVPNFKGINWHLTSNWWRMYQMQPNRTHPEVKMNGNSGYLLSGYTVG